jgi:hypothetical protein
LTNNGFIDYGCTRRERIFIPQHPRTGVIGMDTLKTRYALWERKHADPSVEIQPLGEKLTEQMDAVPGTLASPHSSVILQPTDAAAEAGAPVFCCA